VTICGGRARHIGTPGNGAFFRRPPYLENEMQIAEKYRLEKMIEADNSNAEYGYIHVANNQATVCNGRAMATVPCVVGKGDQPGQITVDSLVYARKHSTFKGAIKLHLSDDETVMAEDTSVFPRSMESRGEVDEEQLEFHRIPIEPAESMVKLLKNIPKKSNDDVILCINAKTLADLSEALGCKDAPITLRLKVKDNKAESAILVTGAEGAFGVIMPCRGGV